MNAEAIETASPAADLGPLYRPQVAGRNVAAFEFLGKSWDIHQDATGRFFCEIPGLGVHRGATLDEVRARCQTAVRVLIESWKNRSREAMEAARRNLRERSARLAPKAAAGDANAAELLEQAHAAAECLFLALLLTEAAKREDENAASAEKRRVSSLRLVG